MPFRLVKRLGAKGLAAVNMEAVAKDWINRAMMAFGFEPPMHLEFHERIRLLAGDHRQAYRRAVKTESPRRVLFLPMVGYPRHSLMEHLLAHALALRGAKTRAVLVDDCLPAGDFAPGIRSRGVAEDARRSFRDAVALAKALRIGYYRVGKYIDRRLQEDSWNVVSGARSPDDLWQIEEDGIRLGMIAYGSTARHYLSTEFAEEPGAFEQARDFVRAAWLLLRVFQAIFDQYRPDVVFSSHGIYVSWGVALQLARRRGIPCYIWNPPYPDGTIEIAYNEPYFDHLAHEPNDYWETLPYSDTDRSTIAEYLESRKIGNRDRIQYIEDPLFDTDRIRSRLRLDPDKPVVGLFSNLSWDAAVIGRESLFDGMNDWVVETAKHFERRRDVQLVVRSHPAEIMPGTETQFTVGDLLRRQYPRGLPDHFRLIPPDDKTSSYALAGLIRTALVYTTKLGLELATMGVPVVVAGDAFYAGKGFTFDPATRRQYWDYLHRLERLQVSQEQRERALRYAHYVFFRRPIPLGLFSYGNVNNIYIRGLCDLLPGRNSHLDHLCERILEGHPHCLVDYDAGAIPNPP